MCLSFSSTICSKTFDALHDFRTRLAASAEEDANVSSVIGYKTREEMLVHYRSLVDHKCELSKDRLAKATDLFVNPFDPPNTRNKRQASLVLVGLGTLLGMAISSVGSWLFPSHNLLGLSSGFSSGISDSEIEIIQQHELQIKINEKSIDSLKLSVNNLIADQSLTFKFLVGLEMVIQYLDENLDEVDRVVMGMKQLSHLRFSSRLVGPDTLYPALMRLKRNLAEVDLEMLPSQLHEFYEQEVSFIGFDNATVRTFLHIPAYYAGTFLDLYEFIPTPLKISEDKFLLPKPEHTVLAVDPESHTLFRTMDRSELARCQASGGRYFCSNQNYYIKDTDRSCLFNLFTNKLDKVNKLCPFLPLGPTDPFLAQIAPTEFVFYQPHENRIILRCGSSSGETDSASFHGVKRLVIPPGCRVNSPSHTFEGELDLLSMEGTYSPHIQRALNLSQLLPTELDQAELKRVLEESRKVGHQNPLVIRDLVTSLKLARSTRLWHWALGIACATLGFFLTLGCVAFLCRSHLPSFRLSRKETAIPTQEEVELDEQSLSLQDSRPVTPKVVVRRMKK